MSNITILNFAGFLISVACAGHALAYWWKSPDLPENWPVGRTSIRRQAAAQQSVNFC